MFGNVKNVWQKMFGNVKNSLAKNVWQCKKLFGKKWLAV